MMSSSSKRVLSDQFDPLFEDDENVIVRDSRPPLFDNDRCFDKF